jgi:hypothetical protein
MGGAVIAWSDTRNGQADIFAQWIQNSGSTRWTTNGITVCAATNHQNSPVVLGNGVYGAFFAWRDQRSGTDNWEVYAQRVNTFGTNAWTADGIKIVDEVGTEVVWDVVSDGAGGTIFSWVDGEGGCFVVFADERAANGDYDIYAQRVERNGYWGYPSPLLTDVEDVPADQGGEVTVRWDASRLDNYADGDITHYSIWRSLTGPESMAMVERGAPVTDIAEVDEGFVGPAIRKVLLGSTAYYWEWVGNMDAHFLAHYAYSTATTDSGYSVDNLAPCAPLALTGEQSVTPEGLDISWDPNVEIDLSHYNVYRGSSDDFVPGAGNRIDCVADTTTFDGEWRWDSGYYYKVSAVDIHGNESLFAILGPNDVTAVDTPDTPLASYLSQNYPNPFNPVTTIRFGLSDPVFVSLRIYDAAGRTVRELVNGKREAGVFNETWDGMDNNGRESASGVYFYKLVAGNFSETRKMVLLR